MDYFQIRKTSRGLRLVDAKGYTYMKDRQFGNKSYWRCDHRLSKCKARASLVGNISVGKYPAKANIMFNYISHGHPSVLKRKVVKVEQNFENDLTDSSMMGESQSQSNQSILKPHHTKTTPISSPSDPSKCTSSPETEMCLRWNSHHVNMQTVFPNLMENERYVDVTLAAEGKFIKCHRLILSSCSNYFDDILKDTYPMQHTVIYMRDMPFWIVKALVDFMYKGEVNIDQNGLNQLLKAAEELQVKGLAGKDKDKVKDEPEKKTTINNSSDQINKTAIKKELKKEFEANVMTEMDTNDEEYYPNNVYKKKLQPVKKIRKRKITAPPDPSSLKHVKINLKGTKSRPNIKQPKFYDPDYPEYDPDRCVSSPKDVDSDPTFSIDSIKMEPIDFEVPNSPSYSEISSLMDQSLTEGITQEKNNASVDEHLKKRKELKQYGRSNKKKSDKNAFSADKHLVFEAACENIDLPSTSSDQQTKIITESGIIANKELDFNKKTIFVNVKNQDIQNLNSTSIQKIINAASKQQNLTTETITTSKFSQIRVRNLPTTENVLKKFATTQLTSILKKDTNPPLIMKKVATKPAILRHSLPKKIEIIKKESAEVAEKLSTLAKTKKELTSTEDNMDKIKDEISKKITDNLLEKLKVSRKSKPDKKESKSPDVEANPNSQDANI